MQLRETTTYDITVEQAFAARTEQAVRERACRESGALAWSVSIMPAPAGVTVTVERTMPPSVPDFVRRFVGDTIVVRQVERWTGSAAFGERHADVHVSIVGQPAKMVGSVVLAPQGSGAAETVAGDVTVSVPFLGRRVEPEIVKVILSALRLEQRAALQRAREVAGLPPSA